MDDESEPNCDEDCRVPDEAKLWLVDGPLVTLALSVLLESVGLKVANVLD